MATEVYDLEKLNSGVELKGPIIILNSTSTVLIEPDAVCLIDDFGNLEIDLPESNEDKNCKEYKQISDVPLDAIELSIFGHRFMSIAE